MTRLCASALLISIFRGNHVCNLRWEEGWRRLPLCYLQRREHIRRPYPGLATTRFSLRSFHHCCCCYKIVNKSLSLLLITLMYSKYLCIVADYPTKCAEINWPIIINNHLQSTFFLPPSRVLDWQLVFIVLVWSNNYACTITCVCIETGGQVGACEFEFRSIEWKRHCWTKGEATDIAETGDVNVDVK